MTDTKTETPTTDLAVGNNNQLPAVIEIGIKPVYLHDIYNGKPGLVIILSERFNRLAQENCVSPGFSVLENMGFTVERGKWWHPEERRFEQGTAYDNHEGYRQVITLHGNDARSLIEDLAKEGFNQSLLPIMVEIEADMEVQLQKEIDRLQSLQQKPSGP